MGCCGSTARAEARQDAARENSAELREKALAAAEARQVAAQNRGVVAKPGNRPKPSATARPAAGSYEDRRQDQLVSGWQN